MAEKLQLTVDIARPVEDVYGFFADIENSVPKMDPGIETVVATTDRPFGAGSEYRMRMKVGRKVRDTKMRIVEAVQNERIGFEAWLGPVSPTFDISFEPVAAGTRVIYSGKPNPVGIYKLFTAPIKRQARGIWKMRLERTKAALESQR